MDEYWLVSLDNNKPSWNYFVWQNPPGSFMQESTLGVYIPNRARLRCIQGNSARGYALQRLLITRGGSSHSPCSYSHFCCYQFTPFRNIFLIMHWEDCRMCESLHNEQNIANKV